MIAHSLASDSYPIEGGDWVLLRAAASGVELLLTQIAKLRGRRMIATWIDDMRRGRFTDLAVSALSSLGQLTQGRMYAVSVDGPVYRLAPR